jgi:hypothetical protein
MAERLSVREATGGPFKCPGDLLPAWNLIMTGAGIYLQYPCIRVLLQVMNTPVQQALRLHHA